MNKDKFLTLSGIILLLTISFVACSKPPASEPPTTNENLPVSPTRPEVPVEFPVEAVKEVAALTELPSFPKMDSLASDTFDCDDAAAYMLIVCDVKGWEYKIIVGNLEMENEKISECNHVWILVNFQGIDIAYDWRYLQTDYQHYKGFIISRKQLQAALESDIYK